jgi:hypothetical protein
MWIAEGFASSSARRVHSRPCGGVCHGIPVAGETDLGPIAVGRVAEVALVNHDPISNYAATVGRCEGVTLPYERSLRGPGPCERHWDVGVLNGTIDLTLKGGSVLHLLYANICMMRRVLQSRYEQRPRIVDLTRGLSAQRHDALRVLGARQIASPYCTALIMSKIGRYIATTMPPTITPRNTIITGSIKLRSPLTAVSTSVS